MPAHTLLRSIYSSLGELPFTARDLIEASRDDAHTRDAVKRAVGSLDAGLLESRLVSLCGRHFPSAGALTGRGIVLKRIVRPGQTEAMFRVTWEASPPKEAMKDDDADDAETADMEVAA